MLLTSIIEGLNEREIAGTLYKKKLQKTYQIEFTTEKVIKRKGDKLYFKLKGYENLFNSWIDIKDIVYKMSYFP